MSTNAVMINLEIDSRLIFAVPVPEWSTQHEMIINPSSSWIKYPSPKGWDWIKLPLDKNYEIIGLSTPLGLKSPDGLLPKNDYNVYGTIIRSHAFTGMKKQNIMYSETDVFLIIEMFV
ncbi:hypothetical protein [Flavobacterium sp.]|uniref:hypothetical protein n=1 Tax=Flavobacterium sp. TaxID=239 RepID=UPI0039E6DB25